MESKEFKVIIVGDDGAGKSSIVSYAVQNMNCEDLQKHLRPSEIEGSTIKVDAYGQSVKLNVWDCNIETIDRRDLIRDTDDIMEVFRFTKAVIIVYDSCVEKSFSSAMYYLSSIMDRLGDDNRTVYMQVANKIDKTTERLISLEEAEKYSEKNESLYHVEISAKTGQGVPELFEMIARQLLHRYNPESVPKPSPQAGKVMDDNETDGFFSEDGDCFKIIIIGDANVGKTSLLLRFSENKFTPTTTSIGYISDRKKLVTVNGKEVNLHVWDTAGQERFMSITNRYYRDTQAVVIVYDCCDEESFNNVRKWYTEVNTYLAPQLDDGMPVVLVANKKDKLSEAAATGEIVSIKLAEELASSKGFLACVETSAKTGDGVNRLFEMIAKELLCRNGPKVTGRVDKVQKQGGNCCSSS